VVYSAYLQQIPRDEHGSIPAETKRQVDTELGVAQWKTPMSFVRPDSRPRVTEDGLKIPDWWTDDETESQKQLAALGLE
jgi:hypothetical protein